MFPQPVVRADSQISSADLPRAARGENDRILIETDCLTAEIWPNGYVSGVKSNTLVDRKTGSRDSSFGLDIVDFLMGPGAEGGIPYQFGDKIHGNIAKHYVELPQICTQAGHIDSDFVIGRDFVAVRQWWRWTEAAPGYTPGSLWEQTIVFPMGRRYFISCDSVKCANKLMALESGPKVSGQNRSGGECWLTDKERPLLMGAISRSTVRALLRCLSGKGR